MWGFCLGFRDGRDDAGLCGDSEGFLLFREVEKAVRLAETGSRMYSGGSFPELGPAINPDATLLCSLFLVIVNKGPLMCNRIGTR